MPDTEQENNSQEHFGSASESRVTVVLERYPWLRWVAVAILAIIIILAIIFGVRAIHHHLSQKNTSGTSQSGSTNVNRPGGSSSTAAGGSKTSGGNNVIVVPGSGSSSSNNSSRTGSSAAANPSLKSGQQLSNTGPGDVVAIFLAATFAAASLHYLVSLRREV